MKLASLPQRRDGRLIVVSNDLAWYADADHIVQTLQGALDEWERFAPLLETLAIELEHGVIPRRRFHEREAAAPLPRAFQRVVGAAYGDHAGQGSGEPLLEQSASDDLRPARSPIEIADASWDADFAGEVCVVTGDVAQGASRDEALAVIRLVGLANAVTLRGLIPDEPAQGLGLVQAKPATAFSPVFATPAALGDAWQDGKLHRPLIVARGGAPVGCAEAGEDMTVDFGMLIAHLAKTRRIGAGTIVGSGAVSNRDVDGAPARPVAEGGRGYSSIAAARTAEMLRSGAALTPGLAPGDTVRIEMRDAKGRSLFGAIEQQVVITG